MIAAIEDVIAAPTTDETAAQTKLIGDNAECGLTVGTAGRQTWRSLWRSCHAGRGEKADRASIADSGASVDLCRRHRRAMP
ncbi:hypothetical protein [Ralstonia sp. 1B3]|uniref:hypothetical protein n=1 Tax=Ralstonia sp. 1B3 TaxID=2997421 RepID=UPI002FC7EF20